MSKNKLIFQERNYKMKKEYDADKLFVANLERVNSYTFEDEVGPTISSTEQPRERSETGGAKPCKIGPNASAPARRWTNL